ncbi:MAG: BPSS1780 family membrane protein [Pseudomonadota bacterium]
MDAENTLPTPATPPQIRTVDVNRAVEWIAGGFRMFMKAPGTWLLVVLALVVGLIVTGIVTSFLPEWLRSALTSILGVVVIGVLMRSCRAFEQGGDFVAHIQATVALQPLWILGLISAALNVGLSVLTGVLGLSSFAVVMMNPSSIFHVLGFGMLVLFAASILVSMAVWLAPALIVFKGVAPLEAVRLSFLGTVKNLVPYIVYSLLGIVICIVAAIPVFLGFLVVVPMGICSWYLAYKDIFEGESA